MRCDASCPKYLGRWVLAATIIGSSMVFIDGVMVNVALPVLQANFNATLSDAQWIVATYALFLAALLLVGGSLGDRFGRRRIFVYGVVLFASASAWCGLAPDVEQLIVARAIQGIGGALLVPGSLAIIGASFSERRRGEAIGIWSGFSAIAAGLGPVLGGWLVDHISWRWAFLINIPLAVIVLLITLWRLPESRDEQEVATLDWWGAVLITVGLGLLVYGLIESTNLGFDHPLIVIALALSAIALLGFLATEARSRAPMMPLTLFHSRTFSGTNVLTLLLYAALAGTMFFFPFNLVQVQGYTATAAGSAFLPFVLIMFALSRWSGGLVRRYGAKLPLMIGPAIAALGFALFAIPSIGGSYWTTFFPAVVVLGFGMALSVAPLTTTVMAAVPSRHAGLASGINNAASRVAALLSVALSSIIVLHIFNYNLDRHLQTIELAPQIRQSIDEQRGQLANIEVPAGPSQNVSATLEHAIDRAFVTSFRVSVLISAALALASALSAWLMIEGKTPWADIRHRSNRRKGATYN